jgi:hypothetical protein
LTIVLACTVEDGRFIVDQRPCGSEGFATRATINVPGMIIDEVLAREGPVGAGRLVEDGHVRLDPMLVKQPPEHLGRAISAIAEKSARIEIEPFERTLNHALGV